MNHPVSELLGIILSSEQVVKDLKHSVDEVTNRIPILQHKMQMAEEEGETLKGQLVLKVQVFHEEECKMKCLSNKEAILIEEKNEYDNKRELLHSVLVKTKEEFLSVTKNFCSEIDDFCNSCSLFGPNLVVRQNQIKEKVQQQLEQQATLQAEITNLELQHNSLVALEHAKSDLEQNLQALKQNCSDLDETLNKENASLKELLLHNREVALIPNTSMEYASLQKELEELQQKCAIERSHCQLLQAKAATLRQENLEKQKLSDVATKSIKSVFGGQEVKSKPKDETINCLHVSNFPKQSQKAFQNTNTTQENYLSDFLDDDFELSQPVNICQPNVVLTQRNEPRALFKSTSESYL